MSIDSINVSRFHKTDHVSLKFTGRVTLLHGSKASVKTAIQAIAAALAPWIKLSGRAPSMLFDFDAEGQFEGRAWSVQQRAGEARGSLPELVASVRERIIDQGTARDVRLPIVAFTQTCNDSQPCNTQNDSTQNEPLDDLTLRSRTGAYAQSLRGGLDLPAFTQWMRWREMARVQDLHIQASQQATPEAYLDLLTSLLTTRPVESAVISKAVASVHADIKDVRYRLSGQSLQVTFVNGSTMPFDSLAGGTRKALFLATQLAWMAIQLNPQDNANAVDRATGVVLIDDLSSETSDLTRLFDTFPGVQFIVATHNPRAGNTRNPARLPG